MSYNRADDLGEYAVTATVRRWQLTESLRSLREEIGLSIEQAADRLRAQGGRWSSSKLSRIEQREQGIKPGELDQLLDLYDVHDDYQRTWLCDLASTAQEQGYWIPIRRQLPDRFRAVVDAEPALVELAQFETLVIPGLLQTADYARAIISSARINQSIEATEQQVQARLARQRVLVRPDPLRYHVILEEAILERPVGDYFIMRNQLVRLRTEVQNGRATIQILPKAVGASPALDGPFSLLSLPKPIPQFVYAETVGTSIYIEDQAGVENWARKFDHLVKIALSSEQSLDLIKAAAIHYEHGNQAWQIKGAE